MRTIKEKIPEKKKTVQRGKTSPKTGEKKLSGIAKYWASIDSGDWEIVDMKAVLR
jgi:hypothetical protein